MGDPKAKLDNVNNALIQSMVKNALREVNDDGKH